MSQQSKASTPSPSPRRGPGGIQRPGLDNRLPAMGGTGATPAVASVPTAQAPQQVAPALDPSISNLSNPSTSPILPEQPLGSSDGFPGAGDQQSAFAVPSQAAQSLQTQTAAGYNTTESAFTGPALGLPGAAGSDLAYQRLTDPDFLAGFYGQQQRTQRGASRSLSNSTSRPLEF